MKQPPICYRYGITRCLDPVTRTPAYETQGKVIWNPYTGRKRKVWRSFGSDHFSPDCMVARTFPTLREAVHYATRTR